MNTTGVLPHFFELISASPLLKKAVTYRNVSADDLEGFDHYWLTASRVILKNFEVARNEWFSEVDILMTSFGVVIDFASLDVKYFEQAKFYFNTDSLPRRRALNQFDHPNHDALRIKINKHDVFNKIASGTVMRSDVFGCKIMTSFY